jgi:small subunit ribosomal protein S9
MADDEPTEHTDEQPDEPTAEAVDTPAAEVPTEPTAAESVQEPVAEETAAEEIVTEEPIAEELVVEEIVVEEPVAEELVVEEIVVEEPVAEELVVEEIVVEEPGAEEVLAEEVVAVEMVVAEELVSDDVEDTEEDEEPAPRVKPTVPGAHLEVDIVPEGVDPLAPDQPADPYAIEEDEEPQVDEESDSAQLSEPISTAAIDLAAGARYNATGKRKTAIARVILRPGTGAYLVNGRALDEHFPRITLQRNIRQPLEAVGYQERMDVVARLQGGGISAQAGALRHGISRALLEADPNLRGELKRRGFLTRDSRAKERKKAGLKKARKRPQFSKR